MGRRSVTLGLTFVIAACSSGGPDLDARRERADEMTSVPMLATALMDACEVLDVVLDRDVPLETQQDWLRDEGVRLSIADAPPSNDPNESDDGPSRASLEEEVRREGVLHTITIMRRVLNGRFPSNGRLLATTEAVLLACPEHLEEWGTVGIPID